MKKLYVTALALFMVGLAAVVFAAPPDPGSAPPGPCTPHQWAHSHHRLGSFLNLSKEQMEKMGEIRHSFFADTHDLRYDIREKRVEMQKLFSDPKVSDAALLAKQKELTAILVKLMDRRARMKVEWRRALTPEQIEKLDRPHPHHGFFHHFHPYGPGGCGPYAE